MQQVYRSTAVARLTYAASAWRSLTKATDRQRINSVIEHARRQGCCSPDLPTFDDLCDAEDDKLFDKAIQQSNHMLHTLLHHRQLPTPSESFFSIQALMTFSC